MTTGGAHSADRSAPRRLPGVEGVWVFIAADMAIFGLLFGSFLFDRLGEPETFEAGRRTLDPDFGGVNTLILLTSSGCAVLAVRAARLGVPGGITRWLGAAFACGGAFVVSKIVEYGGKIRQGLDLTTSPFHAYYFALTGIHLVHVIGGMVVLGWLWKRTRAAPFAPDRMTALEAGASYWHMVDALWIVLFPLLYLLH